MKQIRCVTDMSRQERRRTNTWTQIGVSVCVLLLPPLLAIAVLAPHPPRPEVRVLVVVGVPADWDGTGDYPIAHVEVFAVDQPADFDGGVFGVGFAIGGLADGGPAETIDGDLPILVDTGIGDMILWIGADDIQLDVPSGAAFPAGVSASLSAPPADSGDEPVLQYAFVTGGASQPMAPTQVTWRVGNGINTGRNVLAGADYLFDAAAGRVGFRAPSA
jgi:hypothetical protein